MREKTEDLGDMSLQSSSLIDAASDRLHQAKVELKEASDESTSQVERVSGSIRRDSKELQQSAENVGKLNDDYAQMHETSEVELYAFDKIPWDEISFSSVTFSLENYIDDQKKGILGKCHSNFN